MTTQTRLSRSARNRVSRNARGSKPSGTVPARKSARLGDPNLTNSGPAGIRTVGYLGRNPTRVSYSGSGDSGYRSEWARDGYDFFTDQRWDATVSRPIR